MPENAATKRPKRNTSKSSRTDALQLRTPDEPTREQEARVHLLGPGIVCDTEPRGHATPQGRSPLELVVDSSNGFVPLWAKGETLRWRFHETSMASFQSPAAAKAEVRKLFAESLLAWGSAAPVAFTEDKDLWDFEIAIRSGDNCSPSGCVLASAFFPDAGRHRLTLYPKLFNQTREEQVETLIHEVGHIFGLRHFFAEVSESAWPSEIFGTHSKFSIMNYGSLSRLTSEDRDDLRHLYALAWSGSLTHINGTPIRQFRPYHTQAVPQVGLIAASQIPGPAQRPPHYLYADGV